MKEIHLMNRLPPLMPRLSSRLGLTKKLHALAKMYLVDWIGMEWTPYGIVVMVTRKRRSPVVELMKQEVRTPSLIRRKPRVNEVSDLDRQ